MQLHYPDYYPKFQCTADQCSDNCCIGWEIDVDPDTHARYMAEAGELGERLRRDISTDEPPHFLLGEGERCPFLNDRNLCDIILSLGEDALCEICTQHPRFHEWFGNVKESGVGLCCEAAARLILESQQPTTFLTTEIDEAPLPGFEEDALFQTMLPARELLFGLLQNRAYSIEKRLGAALLFARALQNCLDGDDPAQDITAFVQAHHAAPEFFFQAAEAYELPDAGDAPQRFDQILSFFLTLEPINEHWPERLGAVQADLPGILKDRPAFLRDYQRRMYEYEHLAVYFTYRYLLKAVYDGDVLSKMKLAVVSILLLSALDTARWRENRAFSLEDQVQITKDYSKEMEYCEENLAQFFDESWENDLFSAKILLLLLKDMERR